MIPLKERKNFIFNVATRRKKHKKSLNDSKHFKFPFSFTQLEPSSKSQTFFKLKDFKIDDKIGTLDQKVSFTSLSYQIQN